MKNKKIIAILTSFILLFGVGIGSILSPLKVNAESYTGDYTSQGTITYRSSDGKSIVINADEIKQYIDWKSGATAGTAENNAIAAAKSYTDSQVSVAQNVQSDWNESDTTSDAFIKNKPSIVTVTELGTNLASYVKTSDLTTTLNGYVEKETGKVLSSNDFTDAEKAKLAGLNNYTLLAASDTALGGIKVDGKGLTIDGDGILAINPGSNITLTGGTLNATDTTYRAGTNVEIGEHNSINAKDTRYTLSQDTTDPHKITLTPSDGTAATEIETADTTYSAGNGINVSTENEISVDANTAITSTNKVASMSDISTAINNAIQPITEADYTAKEAAGELQNNVLYCIVE